MRTMSLDEVAEALAVSTRTVEEWVSIGELRAVNVSRNRHSRKPRRRVREADLEEFLAGREVNNASKPARRRQKPKNIKQYV